MDMKDLTISGLIPNDLSPLEFYEYLQEYSGDDGSLWGFDEDEQKVIDEAWAEVQQPNTVIALNIAPKETLVANTKAWEQYYTETRLKP